MNTHAPAYEPSDPVAASVGAEREEYYELLIWIDEGVESTYLIPKEDVPDEFRKYGLAVWLSPDENGKVIFERRTTRVLQEAEYAAKHDKEMDELVKSFGFEE